MRNGTIPPQPSPNAQNTYAPSVPISLYREVAAELQAAQAMLDSLNAQNQQLTKQNQHLRLEIDKVVQSALRLQQVMDSVQSPNPGLPKAPQPHPEMGLDPRQHAPVQPPRGSRPTPNPNPAIADPFPFYGDDGASNRPEKLYTEQREEHRIRRGPRPTKRASDMGGLGLMVVIFLIIVTAFGAGYFVVRPLLLKR